MTAIQTTARNASLEDIMAILKDQHARKHDMVLSANKITSEEGVLRVKGADVEITDEGVSNVDGLYLPTAVCDEAIAGKLGIGVAYLRRMRNERPDMYDANVNGWLHGRKAKQTINRATNELVTTREAIPGDPRTFLFRAFKSEPVGIGRTLLSERFKMIDHWDGTMAALAGIRAAGYVPQVMGGDLSERRLAIRVMIPEIRALAPTLLAGYRSPYSGLSGGDLPVVFAGVVITNSETGDGAYTITPRIIVEACANGLQKTTDAHRVRHVGAKLEDGVVEWSDDTQQANLELIKLETRDSVKRFVSQDYLDKTIADLEEKAGKVVTKPTDTLKVMGKKLSFTEAEQESILDFFIRGGQMTAGGVMQAITAYSQQVEDPDTAWELERKAIPAMEFVASHR